jgi:hypothetical protein
MEKDRISYRLIENRNWIFEDIENEKFVTIVPLGLGTPNKMPTSIHAEL